MNCKDLLSPECDYALMWQLSRSATKHCNYILAFSPSRGQFMFFLTVIGYSLAFYELYFIL